VLRPLGLDEVGEHEPRGHHLAHEVADGAVVFGVGRQARLTLDVGGAVEVRGHRRQAGRAGVVGEGPPHRVRRREHEPPPGAQHPGGLPHDSAAVRHERDDPVRREDPVDAGIGQRDRQAVALQEGERAVGRGVDALGGAQHAHRQVARDDADVVRARQPAGALGGTRSDLEHRHPVAHLHQVELVLGPALGAPDELGVAEEGPVLGVVVLRLTVPPRAVRRPRLVTPEGCAQRLAAHRRPTVGGVLPWTFPAE
jgi:hypothetical protein